MKKMKILLSLLLSLILTFGFLPHGFSGNTFQQYLNVQVACFREIGISSNPPPLIISIAEPGNPPGPVYDSSTTCSISTSCGGQILAYLDEAMPEGTHLAIRLQPPRTDTEPIMEYQELSNERFVSLAGFQIEVSEGLKIFYKFWADEGVTPLSGSRTVTLVATGLL